MCQETLPTFLFKRVAIVPKLQVFCIVCHCKTFKPTPYGKLKGESVN